MAGLSCVGTSSSQCCPTKVKKKKTKQKSIPSFFFGSYSVCIKQVPFLYVSGNDQQLNLLYSTRLSSLVLYFVIIFKYKYK